MYFCGAKFEENRSHIFDLVLYCFSGTIYDVFIFLICLHNTETLIGLKRKKIFPKGKDHS